jgi:hypothetical protein
VPAGLFSTAPVAWYLLRIRPGSKEAARLTRLSIPGQPGGTQVSGIALSPNGSELAVMYQRGVWVYSGKEGPLTLSVYSVSTGQALRTWTQQTNGPAGYGWYWGRYSNSSITWLADGRTIAFTDGNLSGENGPPLGAAFSGVKIRTLDLARPSGDLLAQSKVVFTSSNHWCSTLQLAPDGKSVFCGSYGGSTAKASSAYDPEILQYSVATGKSRLVYRLKGAYNLGLANVLWMNSSGSALFVSVLAQTSVHGQGGFGVGSAGLLAKGTIKQLNLLLSDPFAGEIAF